MKKEIYNKSFSVYNKALIKKFAYNNKKMS